MCAPTTTTRAPAQIILTYPRQAEQSPTSSDFRIEHAGNMPRRKFKSPSKWVRHGGTGKSAPDVEHRADRGAHRGMSLKLQSSPSPFFLLLGTSLTVLCAVACVVAGIGLALEVDLLAEAPTPRDAPATQPLLASNI